MGKKMTINDVAEALGVSVSTVSRAISGKGRIGEATRRRVLDFIEEIGYHPNGIAKSLAQSRTHNIAIIIPDVKSVVAVPFFYLCMCGVNEVAQARGYDMFVVSTNGKDTSHLERLINENKVDGMILGSTYKKDVFAAFLKEKGLPFVTIGSLDDDEVVQVDHDNEGACRDLTAILLSRRGVKKPSGRRVEIPRLSQGAQRHRRGGGRKPGIPGGDNGGGNAQPCGRASGKACGLHYLPG